MSCADAHRPSAAARRSRSPPTLRQDFEADVPVGILFACTSGFLPTMVAEALRQLRMHQSVTSEWGAAR